VRVRVRVRVRVLSRWRLGFWGWGVVSDCLVTLLLHVYFGVEGGERGGGLDGWSRLSRRHDEA